MTLTFKAISVLINPSGCDTVYFLPENVPTAFPVTGYETYLKMDTQAGYGVEWVRTTFGREPDEIISMR